MGLSENNERALPKECRVQNEKSLPLLGLIAHKVTRRICGFGQGGGANEVRTRGTAKVSNISSVCGSAFQNLTASFIPDMFHARCPANWKTLLRADSVAILGK